MCIMEFTPEKTSSKTYLILRCLCLISAVVVFTGCASTSIFIPYPAQASAYKTALNTASLEASLNKLKKHRNSADKVLYMMESGRLNQLDNNFDESLNDFSTVIENFQLQDDKAKFTATGSARMGAAFLANDNAIPYKGEGYERVMVHHYQALNYLAKGDRQAALVEVRRANLEQTLALEKHERDLADAEKEASNNRIKTNPSQYDSYFSTMEQASSQVKSSFQNAYTFYLSGLIYEANGDYNDAYIDYKKAWEIFPENPYLQDDLLRLARQLGMRDDLQRFQKSFKSEPLKITKNTEALPSADTGTLVIFYEHGFVPEKREISVPLFTSQGLQSVSFPVYQQPWFQPRPLKLVVGDTRLESSPIVFTSALAVKALQEKLPGMIIRQTIRAIAKKELQNQANEANALLSLSTQIYNLVSERADLRSWLTLPNDVQIARLALEAGQKHAIQLAPASQSDKVEIDIKPGQIIILKVTDTGARLIKQVFIL